MMKVDPNAMVIPVHESFLSSWKIDVSQSNMISCLQVILDRRRVSANWCSVQSFGRTRGEYRGHLLGAPHGTDRYLGFVVQRQPSLPRVLSHGLSRDKSEVKFSSHFVSRDGIIIVSKQRRMQWLMAKPLESLVVDLCGTRTIPIYLPARCDYFGAFVAGET